jgi:hypothetical protein
MTDVADIISQARIAWARLKRGNSFEDWVVVGKGLMHGRMVAMTAARTNRPYGSRYAARINEWLVANDLAGTSKPERANAVWLIENLETVLRFRATLTEDERRRMCHPHSVRCAMTKSNAKAKQVHYVKANRAHRLPLRPSGDLIRHVAIAMIERHSRDFFILAEAAILACETFEEIDPMTVAEPKPSLHRSP